MFDFQSDENKNAVFSTRSFCGREGGGVISHIKIIETKNKLFDIVSTGSSSKIIKELNKYNLSVCNNNYNPTSEYLLSKKSMELWSDFYDKVNVETFSKYKNIYIVGGVDLWRSNLTRFGKRVNIFPRDKGQISWISTGKILANLLALLKAHKVYNIPLHELAFDPNEMSIDLFHSDYKPNKNYYLYHGYNIPRYNIKRLDSLQYFYENCKKEDREKKYDFCFGYTVLENSNRQAYINDIKNIEEHFNNKIIFCKNNITGENTLIPQSQYAEKLKESNFTFMLPSYDETCFSVYRFIDAIYNDCLPIIHNKCRLDEFESSFNISIKELVFKDNIEFFIKNRISLLEYYKQKIKFSVGLRGEGNERDI